MIRIRLLKYKISHTTKLGAIKKPSIQYALILSVSLKINKKINSFYDNIKITSTMSFFFFLMLMCGIKREYGIF